MTGKRLKTYDFGATDRQVELISDEFGSGQLLMELQNVSSELMKKLGVKEKELLQKSKELEESKLKEEELVQMTKEMEELKLKLQESQLAVQAATEATQAMKFRDDGVAACVMVMDANHDLM